MFSSHKTKYSPDTVKMLNLLMEEANISLSQRQKVKEKMLLGEPLPQRRNSAPARCHRPNENIFGMKKNYYFRRRSVNLINNAELNSDWNFPKPKPILNREKEKEILQDIMTFGKKQTKPTVGKPLPMVKLTKIDRLNELAREIKDRMEFMKKMSCIGKEAEYSQQIQQEIAGKMREMDWVKKMTPAQFESLNIFVKPNF